MSLQIGPYKVVSELGAGGMGVVYRAIDTQISREVALKRLRSEFAASQTVMARFRNEAKLQGRLNHPGIAQLYSLYQGDGATCIVMEFVDGIPLKDMLPLSPEVGAFVMIQILNALDYAHRLGVMHRDIKPENIIIDHSGSVKVMDFGIAHAMGSERMTRERSLIGTIEYMAPERILGKEVTSRSDIYSLGIMLFELLTGQLPMDSVVEFDLLRWHIEQSAPPVTQFVSAAPEFDAVIHRATEKNPEARYATCAEMAADLERFIASQPSQISTLQAAIVEAKSKKSISQSVDLEPIYRSIVPFLQAADLPSAERVLRQQADKYLSSEQLVLDARLAASIVAGNNRLTNNDAQLQQERACLFEALIYERLRDRGAATKILSDACHSWPDSRLVRMAAATTNP